MRASYSRIYIHYIWSTWDRLNLIDDDLDPILQTYILKKSKQYNCWPLQIGGMSDHIHLLVKITTSISIGQFAKNIKGSSSYYIYQIVRPRDFFKWQGGYAAISVSPFNLSMLSKYIAHQKEHHQENSCNNSWELSNNIR